MRNRLFRGPQFQVADAEKQMGWQKVRSLAGSLPELGDGESVITERVVSQSEVDPRLHEVGSESQHFLELFDGMVKTAGLHVFAAGAKVPYKFLVGSSVLLARRPKSRKQDQPAKKQTRQR